MWAHPNSFGCDVDGLRETGIMDAEVGAVGSRGRMDLREACRVDVTGDIMDHLILHVKL